MKSSQEEGEKSNAFQKIKGNIFKVSIQPPRFYSSFKHRPNTSIKIKKSFRLNKLSNNERTFFDCCNFGYTFQTSKYFSKKL